MLPSPLEWVGRWGQEDFEQDPVGNRIGGARDVQSAGFRLERGSDMTESFDDLTRMTRKRTETEPKDLHIHQP